MIMTHNDDYHDYGESGGVRVSQLSVGGKDCVNTEHSRIILRIFFYANQEGIVDRQTKTIRMSLFSLQYVLFEVKGVSCLR